ncbi:MAG: YitT family protein [Simkaniaceae bacterium]|nr:MAG: YitT family protein [Simkaniaceae bacterium]
MSGTHTSHKSKTQYLISYFWTAVGAFLAALSIKIFLFPNDLIDGGIIGISMILTRLSTKVLFPIYFIVLTLPFIYLSYKFIRRTFFIQMIIAVILFSISLGLLNHVEPFESDPLEVIVIGGAILGIGAGLIIRYGGCLDGTEIMAIIINRKKGFTVGQVVLFINIFIFAAYGAIFRDWHIAFRSLLTYVVAFKMMDIVIVGLDELKSVIIISTKPKELTQLVMHEMGLGLTIMYGRGGYSGDAREILFVIVERLDLADLKDLILREDPSAFMAVENLHEVVYGRQAKLPSKKKGRKRAIPAK